MGKRHRYSLTIQWTGNRGTGTSSYTAYDRSHSVIIKGKPEISLSSDPAFRGDIARYNPEELLVASLSSCHMLWYLHLCAEEGITVVDYSDHATGTMEESASGGGRFSGVILNPVVTVTEDSMIDRAYQLHQKANELCFIANSVNFKVQHLPVFRLAE